MSDKKESIGKRVIDIGQLVDVFEVQEGEIQHIIGKTGNGKTYEGTRRALEFLKQGYSVYTTWQLILPDFYDEREDKQKVFWRLLFWRKRFYRFDYKKNWKFLDIDRPDLIQFVAGLTDCVVFLDEGQDIFDSRERIDKASRKVLTRMRHMRKTLIIISQRAQAVDVTARANVTYYYKCVKTRAWFWPFKVYFKVYRTEEMDQVNFPIWEDLMTGWQAEVWQSHFASDLVYKSYNSWYLRAGIPRSQEVSFEAYDLSVWEKIKAFFVKPLQQEIKIDEAEIKRVADINAEHFKESTTFIPKKSRSRAVKKAVDNSVDNSKNMISLQHGDTIKTI
jgi:Zonular occludens toxin (Zot).